MKDMTEKRGPVKRGADREQTTPPGSGKQAVQIIGAAGLIVVLLALSLGAGGFLFQRSQANRNWQYAVELAEQGDWELAIEAYSDALAVWPAAVRQHDTAALAGRGEAYLRAGQYELAIADLDAALGRDPNQLQACLLRLEARLAQEETQAALSEINQS